MADVIKRNNVTRHGRAGAPPMLFAHGFGCDQEMWRHTAPAFEADHEVILYDLTGMGQSDLSAYDPARYGTLDAHAEDMVEICEALDLRGVTLVGQSVSAITAVLAAIRAPDRIARLVLLAPSPCFENHDDFNGGFSREDLEGLIEMMEENYLGWANALAPTIAGQEAEQPGTQELTQSFCRTDPEIARHFGRVTFLSDRRADMPNVTVPSLIVQCARDALAPISVGDWMDAHMPGSTLKVLDVSGHCPHLTAPDKTIEAIRAFVADG